MLRRCGVSSTILKEDSDSEDSDSDAILSCVILFSSCASIIQLQAINFVLCMTDRHIYM